MVARKSLQVKKSTLPGAGKGLFTRTFIPRGSIITEYKGDITTWKKVQEEEDFNGYVFYINRNHVIDARPDRTNLGRYANDAKGVFKIRGITNNAEYDVRNNKVYIRAITAINAGDEILVAYGKEYWDIVKYNLKIDNLDKKSNSRKRA